MCVSILDIPFTRVLIKVYKNFTGFVFNVLNGLRFLHGFDRKVGEPLSKVKSLFVGERTSFGICYLEVFPNLTPTSN